MATKQQFIQGQDRQEIEHFVREMRERASELPTYEGTNCPKDDDASGSYLERSICTGVTLVMDWGYLDIASSYLVVDTNDAPGYDRNGKTLCDCGAMYEAIADDVRQLLSAGTIEYDNGNSSDTVDIWHIHGIMPY